MKKKITNEDIVKNARKKKILFFLTVFGAIGTIVFAVAALAFHITPLIAILCFLVESIATYYSKRI